LALCRPQDEVFQDDVERSNSIVRRSGSPT
jgi:hypothetical protein